MSASEQTSRPAIRTRPRGFSQVEVAVAVVVLAVGLLGVFASFAYGLQASNSSARLTEAVGYSRQLVEIIRARNLPFAYGLPLAANSGLKDPETASFRELPELNAAPFANDLPANTGFRRRITVSREVNDASDYRYRIAEVRVTVLWMERDRLRRVEMTAHHRQP